MSIVERLYPQKLIDSISEGEQANLPKVSGAKTPNV